MNQSDPPPLPSVAPWSRSRVLLLLILAWLAVSTLIHSLAWWGFLTWTHREFKAAAIHQGPGLGVGAGFAPGGLETITETTGAANIMVETGGEAAGTNPAKASATASNSGPPPATRPAEQEWPRPSLTRPPAEMAPPSTTPLTPAITWRTELEPVGSRGPKPPAGLPTPAALPFAGAASAPARFSENPFRARRGAAKAELLQANGGTQAGENAVELALGWLARYQGPDGLWSRQFFDTLYPKAQSGGEPNDRMNAQGNLGVSGLAVLAFTGAGYSTVGEGPYQGVLEKARTALLAAQIRKQPADGGFNGNGDSFWMYDDALATYALAELVLGAEFDGRPDEVGAAALQRAVTYLAATQQAGGGWDYTPQPTGRNDTSITGFMLQALKAAKAAGAKIPPRTVLGLAAHLERATQDDGQVWYADLGTGVTHDKTTGRITLRYGPGMLAVGMTGRLLLGYHPDDWMLERQTALLFSQYSPTVQKLTNGWDEQFHDYYYWYYGSLACLTIGGDAWKLWHPAVREGLIATQRPTGPAKGSWNPFGAGWGMWGRSGGRVYATAINALTLEVFYRYPPGLNGSAGYLLDAGTLNELLLKTPAPERKMIARLAGRLRPALSDPVLKGCLVDPDEDVQLEAALVLARRGERAAEPVLRRQFLTRSAEVQAQISAALQKLAK